MKKVWNGLWIIGLLLIAISCVDDDDNSNIINGPTALDFLMESPVHQTMVQALIRTQLDFNLDQNGSTTIFAPTDQAFSVFLAANGFGSINAIPEDLLRTILLYHFQTDTRTTARFNSQYFKTLAQVDNNQMDVFVANTNNILTVNDEATVIDADNLVSNGIIHVVDDVLDLPSIITLLAANPSFSNFTTALNQEGLSISLSDNEDAFAPFTLFAPSNAAFTALIAEEPADDLNTIEDVLNQDNFDDQLRYHILGNTDIRQDDFMNGAVLNPLGSGTFTVSTISGISILDGSNTTVNLVTTNITAFNGVIHSLDFVLRQQ